MKNTSLLPLYNQILTYQRADNGDDRDEDQIVKDMLEMYGGNKHKYLRFVLFPDIYEPCRPPSLFPHPTHIYRDVGSQNFTATGGALYFAWTPFARDNTGIGSSLIAYNGSSVQTTSTTDIIARMDNETALSFTPPTVTGVNGLHVRGIGAYIQVTYVGRLDEVAGTMEVGLCIEDSVSVSGMGTRYIPTAKLKGLYQYKRMSIVDGVRCIWLPLSTNSLEQVGVTNNGSLSLNQTYHIHIIGATTAANAFRVDYGYFYDGIVDESGFNTLMPKKAPRDATNRDAIVQAVNESANNTAITPANLQDNGLLNTIWSTVKQGFTSGMSSLVDFGVKEGIGLGFNSLKYAGY